MGQQYSPGDVRQVTQEVEQKYGLPADTLFKMSGIESSHGKNMLSPKGAQGWFGFMPPTAKAYGLDDPNDLAKSADAAGRYMRDNLQRFNGNMDMALADYNGGGKAVKALAKGKPWPETADYLTKFHGEKYVPLSSQFTTGESVAPTASASASELVQQQRQQERDHGGLVNNITALPTAFAEGWKADNSVYNFWKTQGIKQTDPNFRWSDDFAKQVLDGVDTRHWDYVMQAKSEAEANARRSRVMESLKREQDLAQMGVAGMTGRITASLLDLPTLIAFIPAVGGTGALTTTSRIANAVRMGLITAGTNVAYDAVANQYKPLAQDHDLYISAAMGFGLGALSGGAVNPQKLAAARLAAENKKLGELGLREFGKAQIKELEDNGFKLTPKGEEYKKSIDTPKTGEAPPKEPGISILHPGEKPEEPRVFGPEKPIDSAPKPLEPKPEGKPVGPGPIDDPLAPPRSQPWGAEWDTPKFMRKVDGGERDLLVIPKAGRVSELAQYVREFSQNKDLVAVMNRVLKGIDLRRLEFKVLEQGEKFGHRSMDKALMEARGAVLTPWGSEGDGIKMFLRGHSFADNGMNEETFIHELVHAASVYKQNVATSEGKVGMTATAEVTKANEGMRDLFNAVRSHARQTFGTGWRNELQGRLGVNMQNEKEMLAYGLTNRNFQEHLKSIPLVGQPDKSMWDRFVTSLRKLLGVGAKEHNALSRLIELSSPLTEKGGVKRTTANLVDAHGVVDVETVKAANEAGLSEVFGWGLGLEHRLGNAKVPTQVRELASKLFGTTVGYKDHAVVKANVWDDTIKLAEGWAAEVRKGSFPAFEDWFKQSGKSWHEKAEAFDHFGTQVSNYIRGMEGEYPEQVKKAGEAMRSKLAEVVDHINNPLLEEGGVKKGLTMTEVRDPKTGKVTLEGGLEKNPNYLPRKHDINKWNSMVQNFGREAVEGWWARAYQKGRPDITDEAAGKWSKWYVKTVEEAHANRSGDLLEDMMRGQDKEALKHSLIHNGGFSESEALKVIEGMFPSKPTDAGRMNSSLKHRNTVDETHMETWTMKDGTKHEIGLNDFIRSNALEVIEPYLRRTASNVALARHLDVYTPGDIGRMIEESTRNKLGSAFMHSADLDKYRKDLQFAFDRIQALPVEQFSTFNKSMAMWRNFNVIRLMGGAVWNQMVELGQITGTMGWKATLGAVGELRSLSRDIKTGKAPHEWLDHLENTIGGAGAEYVTRFHYKGSEDWVRHKGDTLWNRRLDAMDTGLKKLASRTLDYTGMTGLMIQQKRVHAIALVNHFIDHATGKSPSKFLSADRLAWMGLGESDAKQVFDALKTYTKPAQGQFTKDSFKLDYKRWMMEDPESHAKFMNAVHRESRRVIQENDLASMIPLMGTTLGQTVFQFMNFTLHGWNKSLMFSLNHRDTASLMSFLHGGFLGSLAYMGRTYVDAMGKDATQRDKFMEQRMSFKQIVANSFAKTSQASMLPNLYDTLAPEPVFSGARTTSDVSGLASNPTYGAVNGVISLKKLIRNGYSSEYQTTEKDIRNWGKLLPLNNVFPMSTMLNHIAQDYPQHEKQQ